MKVSSVEEMQQLDGEAVRRYGIDELLLMENAGIAVYTVINESFGIDRMRFSIFCGGGNNGGDGLVVARKIVSAGGEAAVYLLSDPEKLRGVARHNYDIARRLPLEIVRVDSPSQVEEGVRDCDAIVDALLGTGITGEVRGIYRETIEIINRSGRPVFSVDIPSGVNGDTGLIMGTAIKADHTVTFGLPKVGTILYPGFERCGMLHLSHISFPRQMYEAERIKTEIYQPTPLPGRERDGHKGTFGQALFIAGAAGYMGAPYFAALSFLKAGGGYSRLASPRSITPFLAGKGSEIVFLPQKETQEGSLSMASGEGLLEVANQMDIVVIGPGLSLNEETQELVRSLVSSIKRPLIVDGDGITAIAADLDTVRGREAPTALTPHPGEMCRIAKVGKGVLIEKRLQILRETAAELGSTIVLKGAHSQICHPDGRVFINLSGNPGMATAGSGDVLTGTIAAMFGLGLDFEEAVRMGTFVHGLSGDIAAWERGEDGMTAQDVLGFLPEALRLVREELDILWANHYGKLFVL